jgi:hypothetical protein
VFGVVAFVEDVDYGCFGHCGGVIWGGG